MRIANVAVALSLTLVACGGADLTEPEALDSNTSRVVTQPDGGATFVFTSDFGYHGTGTRTPGTTGTIVYDTSRLPTCRATEDSVAAWSISALISADGATAVEYPFPSGQQGTVSVPFEIPYASDLAIWFHSNDTSGCQQWDSNYGGNFHFSVNAPADAVIHFASNFTTQVDASPGEDHAIKGGTTIAIDYAFSRLAQCRASYGPSPAWSVVMFSQIDSGAVSTQDLEQVLLGTRIPGAGTIALPQGAHTLTLWFENSDVTGCNAWDSAYGQNYTFDIQ